MYYILYFFLDNLSLHVSDAICTHHKENNSCVNRRVLYGLVCLFNWDILARSVTESVTDRAKMLVSQNQYLL
jgi:hypothetical protein